MSAKNLVVGLLLLATSIPVEAVQVFPTIIWDQTVAATDGTATSVVENIAARQNFGDPVSFSRDTLFTGFDVFTAVLPSNTPPLSYGSVGTPVVIRIRAGANNGPLTEFSAVIGIQDFDGAPSGSVPSSAPDSYFVRAHADLLDAFTFEAHMQYWVGMSGDGVELGQGLMTIGKHAPKDATTTQYWGADSITLTGICCPDQISMFRLWGTPENKVPEPGTLALLGLGLAGLGLSRRRKA